MGSVKTRDIIAYTTMPRIVPRIKSFLFSGFGFLTLLIAYVYAMVRLLPQNHPYLDPKNMGRYGIRHVIIEASKNLVFSRKNIDQILVFGAVLAAIVILFLQFAILFYTIVAGHANAFSWFNTAVPATDVAYTLLDRVFGVPNVFCSTIPPINCTTYSNDVNMDGTPGDAIPAPFHIALHELFSFYSTGILLIAMIIFLYFIVVVILETAVTGTPFGQRFQNVWVPIRLVVAIGLLVPVNFGLNSGQWITLYVAKYGSSFATNGWHGYNDAVASHASFASVAIGPGEMRGNPLGERYSWLALPEPPDITPLIQTMALVHSCAYLYHLQSVGVNPNPTHYATGVVQTETGANLGTFGYVNGSPYVRQPVHPYLVKTPPASMIAADGSTLTSGVVIDADVSRAFSFVPSDVYHGIPYLEALGFYGGGDIIIRFGESAVDSTGKDVHVEEMGGVKPICGDVRIPITSLKDADGFTANRGGVSYMQDFYYRTVLNMWYDRPSMTQFARVYTTVNGKSTSHEAARICNDNILSGVGSPGFPGNSVACQATGINQEWKAEELKHYMPLLLTAVRTAWRDYVQNGYGSNMTVDIYNKGWGGAGIWFSKVAEVNGGFVEAVRAVPSLDKYPSIMEEVRKVRGKVEKNQSQENPYNLYFVSSDKTVLPELHEKYAYEIGVPLSHVYEYFNNVKDMASEKPSLGNVMMNAMNIILGTSGLMSIRGANAHIHPLAQLVAVGKSLVESAVRNIAAASVSSFMGGLIGAFEGQNKSLGSGVLQATSSLLLATAFMGLTAGFILFYILPFLPFVYFYFAVGSWIKSIFEAMVGIPLWALAHLRIDGDGLPGDAAQNGYFLLLEIFIRPILTVFGLIAAITIFSTQVYVLNMIWELVTSNATGFTPGSDVIIMTSAYDIRFQRGIVDQFFFTIIYTIICYMLALASFKLVDMIPDNILRWAGAGVSSFGDIDKDHVESLNRYAAMGGMTVGSQASQAVVEGAGGLGSGLGLALKGAKKAPTT